MPRFASWWRLTAEFACLSGTKTHAICRGNIFATEGSRGHRGASGDPRRAGHWGDGWRPPGVDSEGAYIFRGPGIEEGRPLRLAGGEQHSVDGARLGCD